MLVVHVDVSINYRSITLILYILNFFVTIQVNHYDLKKINGSKIYNKDENRNKTQQIRILFISSYETCYNWTVKKKKEKKGEY